MIRKLALVIALACAAFIIFATLSPIQLRPKTGHFNIERFAAFFVLGAAFVTAYPKYWLIVALGVVTGACGLEVGQLYVPGRDGDVHDAILKSFGGLTGVAVAFSLKRMLHWKAARSNLPQGL